MEADNTEERSALIAKFAHLKPTAMSSPFLSAFSEQESLSGGDSNDKGELKIVKYREEEAIYVQASADRVTVIFGTVFKEETDRIYGRLFLQVRFGLYLSSDMLDKEALVFGNAVETPTWCLLLLGRVFNRDGGRNTVRANTYLSDRPGRPSCQC